MTDYSTFVDAYLAHQTSDPNSRVYLGLERDLGVLPDPSLAENQRCIASATALLEQVSSLQDQALSFDQKLDLDLARLTLEDERHSRSYTFNGRGRLEQLPSAGDDIGDAIFTMMVNDPRPAAERLDDITSRLEQTPRFLASLLERLDTPVSRWVNIDQKKVEGLPSLLETIRAWANTEEWTDLRRLEIACDRAEAALKHYSFRLKALPVTPAFHLGEDLTREVVALDGIDKSIEELHAMARTFLDQTGQTIRSLAQTLIQRYKLPEDTPVSALQSFLHERYAVPLKTGKLDEILDHYQAERKKLLAFIQARDLFPILEEQEMRILRTPPFMTPSIPAGAMMPPPPMRAGMRTSVVYLTLAEDLLPEHTQLSIPTMMIHEGIPGHHLQLATASAHPSQIRRIFESSHHAEGWTTMLEDYMLDQGYMGDLTDEARFMGKLEISRIGARVAIDLFFMSGERDFLDVGVDCDISSPDPFVAAGKLLTAVTGFVPSRTQAELNWYSQARGYPLSYLTGNQLVWELKHDLAAGGASHLPAAELDRLFHQTYLLSGNMPVSFLRRVFEHEGWSPRQR